jgi:uncharacterized protein YutE (UPF0331/DUF86 family)
MVSIEKVTEKFRRLDEFLAILKGMRGTPLDAFQKDKILIGSAKYYLQVSIECCLDVANHINFVSVIATKFLPRFEKKAR